jgi:hypothetical protein
MRRGIAERLIIGAVVLAGALFAALAGNGARTAEAAVTVQRMNYKGWDDSYRLTNGTVEVVVVPRVARILRYGYVGGPNLLWEGATAANGPKIGEWVNYGGDKAWPWPQDDWGTVTTGKYGGWPPPPDVDQQPHEAKVVGTDTVRTTSAVLKGFGLRIVREITLAPTGTKLTVVTRFEQAEGDAPLPVAPWTVTQVPHTEGETPFLVRQIPGTFLSQGIRREDAGAADWKLGEKQGNVLTVTHSKDSSGKAFFDGDAIGAVYGDTLFTVRADTRLVPPAQYVPGDRAQIYQNDKGTPYAEWEFTAPLRALKKGESSSLTTVFTLRRLPDGKRTPADAAPLLGAE